MDVERTPPVNEGEETSPVNENEVSSRSDEDGPEPSPAVAEVPNETDRTVVRVPVNVRNASLSVLAVLSLVALLRFAQEVFVPIVLSVLISYALSPVVSALSRVLRVRAVAAAVVLLAVTGASGFAAYSLRGQAAEFLNSLPDAMQKVRERVRAGTASGTPIDKVREAASELQKTAADAAETPGAPGVARVRVVDSPFNLNDYLWWGSRGILSFAGQVFVIFFLVFFLLASGDMYRRKFVRMAGPSFYEKRLTVQIMREIDRQIEMFLLLKGLASLVVGVLTAAALYLLGIPQPAIWGLLAALLNPIPYIGPAVVAGGIAVVTFLQTASLTTALYASGATMVITGLEGVLLAPVLMSRATRINQVAVFVGLLFWSWLWGAWGTLLAVPMLVVVKTICDRVDGLRGVSELLGEE